MYVDDTAITTKVKAAEVARAVRGVKSVKYDMGGQVTGRAPPNRSGARRAVRRR